MKFTTAFLTTLILTLALPPHLTAQTKLYRGAEYRTIGAMTYGRFEVRMRSAQVSGMLSSFFTYADPANPWNEIDIEIMGRYNNEIQYNTIVPTVNDNHTQRYVVPFNPHAAFHVHAIEWTPDYVAWFVDGVEVYRQTGTHVSQLSASQKLMMNIWQPIYVDWAGTFNPASLPVYAYYDWIKYYSYTPGIGDNFTLQWTDNLGSFDPTRWQKATHTWDGNNCQFVQANVAFSNGYMVLCMTDNLTSGYSGGAVVDEDVDPPYLVSARASLSHVRVLFSEVLDSASAGTPGNYLITSATVQTASLLADGRSVDLAVSGLKPQVTQNLIVVNVKDISGRAIGLQSKRIIPPLSLPVRIDVGGSASAGYLGDSVWSFARQYGAVGGTTVQASPTLEIAGTEEDGIFRSSVEGISFYNARVPTENMYYDVTLMFAETEFQNPGQRVFDVSINGSQPTRVDIVQGIGPATAWYRSFANVPVSDGMIQMYFAPVVGEPVLSGIIIEPVMSDVGEDSGKESPTLLGLSVFPNPFNGSANFIYSLPERADVSIEIFDLLGRKVSSIPLGYQERGSQTFRWSQNDLASGVYFCSLLAGERNLTRQVLLVR